MTTNLAERNDPFIRYFLDKIGKVTEMKISGDNLDTIPTTCGLYVFYVKFNETSKERYPVYVGVTRRSFRQRFKEHDEARGVIDKVTQGKFPKNFKNLGLHACFVELPAVTSKFVESVLLGAFDFCLNTDENEKIRETLDNKAQHPADMIKTGFDQVWMEKFDSINDINKSYYEKCK